MGEEEGLFSNVSGNIIVQTRRRMRDDCTAERCPECEGEEQGGEKSLLPYDFSLQESVGVAHAALYTILTQSTQVTCPYLH